MHTKKTTLVVMVAAVLILVGTIIFLSYSRNRRKTLSPTTAIQSAVETENAVASSAAKGVLPSIGSATAPLQNQPNLNPIQTANPFNTVKTNPFQ